MQAPSYIPTTDFSDDEANNTGGRSTVRTQNLDTELQNISTSINASNANLALLQRDDGALLDGVVDPNNLSSTTKAYVLGTKWNARGIWATMTAYVANDMVEQGGSSYICVVAHTSGIFATDRSAGYWQVFVTAATANSVAFTPTTSIASTDVQSALVEIDTKSRAASDPLIRSFYGGF